MRERVYGGDGGLNLAEADDKATDKLLEPLETAREILKKALGK